MILQCECGSARFTVYQGKIICHDCGINRQLEIVTCDQCQGDGKRLRKAITKDEWNSLLAENRGFGKDQLHSLFKCLDCNGTGYHFKNAPGEKYLMAIDQQQNGDKCPVCGDRNMKWDGTIGRPSVCLTCPRLKRLGWMAPEGR